MRTPPGPPGFIFVYLTKRNDWYNVTSTGSKPFTSPQTGVKEVAPGVECNDKNVTFRY